MEEVDAFLRGESGGGAGGEGKWKGKGKGKVEVEGDTDGRSVKSAEWAMWDKDAK
jgi:hypothetical protein